MRAEKKYLVEELVKHLDKSDYVFVADYNRITVFETAELRKSLAEKNAEFHVVKNSILDVAAKEKSFPELDSEWLKGQSAIVIGGDAPSEVAKILLKFKKDKDKVDLKGGIMDGRILTTSEIETLSKLPSLEVLRAQLLGTLNAPAQQMVRVLQAIPEGVLNVLQAKVRASE